MKSESVQYRDIIFVVDKRYYAFLMVTMYSILKNNLELNIRFWVVKDGDFLEDSRELKFLKKNFNFVINFISHEVNITEYGDMYRPYHISKAAYNKFRITQLLPNELSRVLYLDCDIIVKDNINYLFELDLEKYYLAAVSDGNAKYASTLGLPVTQYFNSGVMVFNLDLLRERNIEDIALKFLSSEQNPRQTSDQDAFNIIAKDKWLSLDDEWNYMVHKLEYYGLQPRKRPKIIHYTLNEKPWSLFYESPFKQEYVDFLNELEMTYILDSQWDLIRSKPLFIYTASKGAEVIANHLYTMSIEVEGFIDRNKASKTLLNKPIFGLEKLNEDIVIINASITYENEIKKLLMDYRFHTSAFSNKFFLK